MPSKSTPSTDDAPKAGAKSSDRAEIGGVKELVKLGKEKGYVTYDDVNELLDDDVTEESDIEDVLVTLRESHVEVQPMPDMASLGSGHLEASP